MTTQKELAPWFWKLVSRSYTSSGGSLPIWLMPVVLLTAALVVDVYSPHAHQFFLFQRVGAFLTAVYVPFFAIVLGKLTTWRSRLLVDQARLECKELFGASLLAKAVRQSDEINERIDSVLKISAHRSDHEATEETVSLLENSTMLAFGIVLFAVTIVWGFGDLISTFVVGLRGAI